MRTDTLNRERILGIGIRVLVDAVLTSLSLAFVLILQVAFLAFGSSRLSQATSSLLAKYSANALPLTVCVLAVMAAKGLYTRTRSYQPRYKVFAVFQATAIGCLLVASLNYVLPGSISIGPIVLAAFFIVNSTMLIGARMAPVLLVRLGYADEQVSKDRPRRVLVIGGAGYIGSALLPKLLADGYFVRVLDSFIFGMEPIADIAHHPNLEIVRADFRVLDQVVSSMDGMDAVVHLGAIVGDPACALDEPFTIEVNLVATRTIAEIAKGKGISKFIFASTCSVYGASDGFLDEKSALNPVSLYARSKIASERVLADISTENFRPTILRFGTIYGLSGRTRFDLVVNLLSAMALVDKKITVYGNDQWRPFVHVSDAAKAVLLTLNAPIASVGGMTLNVGSNGQNYTLGQVGQLIKDLVPEADLISEPSGPDRRNYRVNFGLIENLIGFKPEWTLESGVTQVLEAIKSGQVQNYKDALYSNVKFLTESAPSVIRTKGSWAREMIYSDQALIEVSEQPHGVR